ncbi:MAG TPA: hypothetical protein VGY53_13300 [Isosphaeraceae bacterium]|nr:hypothetical protein [Isosphaeraceae bacterium]
MNGAAKQDDKAGLSAYALGYHERQSKAGYSLWEYTGGAWVLRQERCGEGHASGSPPQDAGTYEGEIRRKSCVPINILEPVKG